MSLSGLRLDRFFASSSADLERSERTMIVARWVATPWVFLQVITYSTLPYPPGVQEVALALAAVLPLGNLGVWLLHRRIDTASARTRLSLASLGFDIVLVSGFVWLFAFDQLSALWAVLLIIPLEGAIRFGLPGAMWTWVAIVVLYVPREIWGSSRYGYRLQWDSISFRMGIGLLIALVSGLMARDLRRQRERVALALEEVQRVDRLRAGLVSALAHDIRTPLTTIRGSIQTLRRKGNAVDADSTARLLEAAERQATRLQRLAADLLDLARLEEGQLALDVSDVELEPLIRRALSFLEGAQQFEVDIPEGLRARGDPSRLEQVVVNLAQNALAYGSPPYVAEGERIDAQVRLRFRDQGPGIPPDRQEKLFEPFAARGVKGSVGLGLAISTAMARAHGGDLRYVPNVPRGACFELTLPAADSLAP